MNYKRRVFCGFSLIELLVSISIISILMAAAFAVLRPLDYFKRTRDSRRISDLKVIQTVLEQYYASNNGYPVTGAIPFGSSWSPYSRLVPNDPDSSKAYCYNYSSPNYILCAGLEMGTGTPGTCSVTSYNYCITNPF